MSTMKGHGVLAAAMFGKSRRSMLAIFYGRPEESFYLRQVVRQSGLAQGAVQRELKHLADAGILTRARRGREVHYQANRQCPVFEELHGLMAKTAGVADVLHQALLPLASRVQAAFIYGSQARGAETAGSDVDLLVIGDVDEMKLHRAVAKAESRLGRSVNYSLLSPSEFARRRKEKGGFLARVTGGPRIMVLGDMDEI